MQKDELIQRITLAQLDLENNDIGSAKRKLIAIVNNLCQVTDTPNPIPPSTSTSPSGSE